VVASLLWICTPSGQNGHTTARPASSSTAGTSGPSLCGSRLPR
jgi:hypothetical protein